MGRNRKKTGSGAVGAPPAPATEQAATIASPWKRVEGVSGALRLDVEDGRKAIFSPAYNPDGSFRRDAFQMLVTDSDGNRLVSRIFDAPDVWDPERRTYNQDRLQEVADGALQVFVAANRLPESVLQPSATPTTAATPVQPTPARPTRAQRTELRIAEELQRISRRVEQSINGDDTFNQVEMRNLLAERIRAQELAPLARAYDKAQERVARLTQQRDAANDFDRPRIAQKLQQEVGKRARLERDYMRRAEAPISFGEQAQAQRRIDVVRGMIANRDLRGRSDIARELLSDSETRVESGARAPRTRSARSRLL